MIMKENRFEFTSPQKGFKVLSKSRSCGYLTADFTTLTMPTKEALKINHVINVAIIYDKVVEFTNAYFKHSKLYPLFALAIKDTESPTAQYLFRIIAQEALKLVLDGNSSINDAVKAQVHCIAQKHFSGFSIEYTIQELKTTEEGLENALRFYSDVYNPSATVFKNLEKAVEKAAES